jgi:hypothetical protein
MKSEIGIKFRLFTYSRDLIRCRITSETDVFYKKNPRGSDLVFVAFRGWVGEGERDSKQILIHPPSILDMHYLQFLAWNGSRLGRICQKWNWQKWDYHTPPYHRCKVTQLENCKKSTIVSHSSTPKTFRQVLQ